MNHEHHHLASIMAAEDGVLIRHTDGQQKNRKIEDVEAAELRRRTAEAHQVYGRGRKISAKSARDKKLRHNLKSLENKYQDATLKAKDAEILLENESGLLEPEGELERTYKVQQDDLKPHLTVETAKKGFELKLEDLGPYVADYTRNGRDLLLAGRKGHVSTMDWRAGELGCELQLGENVRDAKWLHNNQYFAVAQKNYVYIYDHAGVEIHCLQKHIDVHHMQFLPYHFLLATVVCSTPRSLHGCFNLILVRVTQAISSTPTPQPARPSLKSQPSSAHPQL